MSTPSKPHLHQVLTALRQRWGADAVRPLSQLRPGASLPTGFEALDQILGQGGVPCGGIIHLSGQSTSGMVTLALHIVARAQAAGYAAIALDLTRTLDLDYGRRCGVLLDRLVLVWPQPPMAGLDIVRDIITHGITAVFLFDATAGEGLDDMAVLVRSLRRVKAVLASSHCIFLCLTPPAAHPCVAAITPVAALQLEITRVDWQRQACDVTGYDTQITIRRDPHGSPGRSARVSLQVDEYSSDTTP